MRNISVSRRIEPVFSRVMIAPSTGTVELSSLVRVFTRIVQHASSNGSAQETGPWRLYKSSPQCEQYPTVTERGEKAETRCRLVTN